MIHTDYCINLPPLPLILAMPPDTETPTELREVRDIRTWVPWVPWVPGVITGWLNNYPPILLILPNHEGLLLLHYVKKTVAITSIEYGEKCSPFANFSTVRSPLSWLSQYYHTSLLLGWIILLLSWLLDLLWFDQTVGPQFQRIIMLTLTLQYLIQTLQSHLWKVAVVSIALAMQLFHCLILFCLGSFPSRVFAATSCYRPNGTDVNAVYRAQFLKPVYEPCNAGDEHSMCCAMQRNIPDKCRSDGLCLNEFKNLVWRDSCTDPTWKSPHCVKLCTQGSCMLWYSYLEASMSTDWQLIYRVLQKRD